MTGVLMGRGQFEPRHSEREDDVEETGENGQVEMKAEIRVTFASQGTLSNITDQRALLTL